MGLVLGIFISWFLCLNCKPVQTTNNNSTKIVLPDSACVSTVLDSLSFVVDRMDGLEKEVNDIRCNYQMEVDLAIDKANGWLAFWIGVLALVIGLMSIWQMYRQNKSEEKFQVLEKNLNSKANVAYKDIRKKADGEIKRIEDELAGVGNGIDAVRHKLKESQMGSLMMCLNAFPDPQMTSDAVDRKRQTFVLVKHISSVFHEYVIQLKKKQKATDDDPENVFLVLTMVKLCVVRTHGIYSDIHQNIRIKQLIDLISETNDKLLKGESFNIVRAVCNIDNKLRGLLEIIER